MRFPFRQTLAVSRHIIREKRRGTKHFPLVLMLEPLHTCNLTCGGCGRIREYKDTLGQEVTLKNCLDAAEECGAPVVSICGGEPLIYNDIKALVDGLLAKKKVVYLCTNGILLDKKIDSFRPHTYFNINVHVDGLEATHDLIVGRTGTFKRVVENIRLAKKKGFTVCTNTTIYHETKIDEVRGLLDLLTSLGVDGMLISPSFEYTDVQNKEVFLTREEIVKKFAEIEKFLKGYRTWSTPLYIDFLRGKRDYRCTPWGNVTYNIRGWKAPCYLITDGHFDTFKDFLSGVDWVKYQSGQDLRCKNCMVHCGFEATAALETGKSIKDVLKMAWWTVF